MGARRPAWFSCSHRRGAEAPLPVGSAVVGDVCIFPSAKTVNASTLRSDLESLTRRTSYTVQVMASTSAGGTNGTRINFKTLSMSECSLPAPCVSLALLLGRQEMTSAKGRGRQVEGQRICPRAHGPSWKACGRAESRRLGAGFGDTGRFAPSSWVAPYHLEEEGSSPCQLRSASNQRPPPGCPQVPSRPLVRVRGYCMVGTPRENRG